MQQALGEPVSSAKEGLLALSVGVGLGVLAELMEEEVDEVVGPRGRHNPERGAVRDGHECGEVTLGGRRVQVERPRVRSVDGESEVWAQPVDGGDLGVDRVQVAEHVLEGGLGERVVEALSAQPRLMAQRPGFLALPVDASVAQQLLADSVAGGGARPAQVVAAAHQVTQALLLGRRDPIARPHRRQRGSDDVARHPERDEQPVELVAARARLVADSQPAPVAEPCEEATDRLLRVLELDERDLTAPAGNTPAVIAFLCTSSATNVRAVFTEAFELTSGTTGPPSP